MVHVNVKAMRVANRHLTLFSRPSPAGRPGGRIRAVRPAAGGPPLVVGLLGPGQQGPGCGAVRKPPAEAHAERLVRRGAARRPGPAGRGRGPARPASQAGRRAARQEAPQAGQHSEEHEPRAGQAQAPASQSARKYR